MAKDGYGVTLYDINDGKRKSLSAVVMRFKRLDWGAWIRSNITSLVHSPPGQSAIVHLFQAKGWSEQKAVEEKPKAAGC